MAAVYKAVSKTSATPSEKDANAGDENARKISELGYEISPSSPAELASHTAAELKKWTEVAKAADVKAD